MSQDKPTFARTLKQACVSPGLLLLLTSQDAAYTMFYVGDMTMMQSTLYLIGAMLLGCALVGVGLYEMWAAHAERRA